MTVLISSPCFVLWKRERDQKFWVADGIVTSLRVLRQRGANSRGEWERGALNFFEFSRDDKLRKLRRLLLWIFFGDERVKERIDQVLLRGQFG